MPITVQAADGLPDSPKFGFGARLIPDGLQVETAIRKASEAQLDWLSIELDWAQYQPDPGKKPNWQDLDTTIFEVGDAGMSVMVSLTHAPDWAMTAEGPDPIRCANLIQELVRRYSGIVLAIELFPGMNTFQGWGATPNPTAYAELVKYSFVAIQEVDPRTALISGGLIPTLSETESQSNDLAFLRELYAEGISSYLSIIGLRLENIATNPQASPLDSSSQESLLRHYEAVRSVMLENSHQNGLIWITAFSPNSQAFSSPEKQAQWLENAITLLRAQLYIGTAFINHINPQSTQDYNSLIRVNGEDSSSFLILANLIQLDAIPEISVPGIGPKKIIHPNGHTKIDPG